MDARQVVEYLAMSSRRSRITVPRVAAVVAATIGLGVSLWLGVAAAQLAAPQEDLDPNENPAYYREGPFLDGYRFNELPLDPDSLFYPSSATTRSGGYYSEDKLLDVERCGDAGCHPDIYDQWYESTHHLASFNDPWYRRTFQFFDERSGRGPAQWCAGCHDPAVMMTGVLAQGEPLDFDAPGSNIGISCQFCHSVGTIDASHANASYELAPSAPLPEEGATDPARRRAGNQQLLSDAELIRQHAGDRRRSFLVLGEFCGTCHKQSLITPVNNYKWLRGFDEFDGWQNSGISGFSARSFYYPPEPRTCQQCHMPEVPSNDAGADDGMVNSHRFLGANTALSAFHGYGEQLRATAEFLQNDIVRVDIFALREGATRAGASAAGEPPAPATGSPADSTVEAQPWADGLIAPADAFDLAVAPGATLDVDVVVRTLGIGHLFPGGTVDSNMPWLELVLLDEAGEPLLMSGGMDEDSFVDPEAHSYRGIFLDEAGQELIKRNGWDRRAAVYVRMIPPGAADTVHFRFTVPEDAAGTLQLRARLNYRKHKQSYNRWALGADPAPAQPAGAVSDPGVDTRQWVYDDSRVIELPVVIMAEDTLRFAVVPAAPPSAGLVGEAANFGRADVADPVSGPQQGEVPASGARTSLRLGGEAASLGQLALAPEHRTRFNDWGIGLLLQGDLRDAVTVFRLVQQIDPTYADGFVNEARAFLMEGDLDAAEAALQRALELQPDGFKASYFMSQVAAGRGEFERAVELLERVKRDFPYDRQVRLDLARIHYLEGRYEAAVQEGLAALDIDPEELGAHYTLALAYRAMGDTDKAAIHDARYRRYKDDEDIQAITGPFRLGDAAANREKQMIHVHVLAPPEGRFSAGDRFPIEAFLEGGPHYRPPTAFPGPTAPWLRNDR
jgi:tetratricopeptide (TPR) repeat protein